MEISWLWGRPLPLRTSYMDGPLAAWRLRVRLAQEHPLHLAQGLGLCGEAAAAAPQPERRRRRRGREDRASLLLGRGGDGGGGRRLCRERRLRWQQVDVDGVNMKE